MTGTLAKSTSVVDVKKKVRRDGGFAAGIIVILCLFFLPVPAIVIDMGLAISIALSVLILMVALWIEKPLEFSAFPTVLLVATILRLALNISTTRLILAHGSSGTNAAGNIINGFAKLVMGGDFVIGIIVFLILITINFLVITKGATRIAEVGARFTLDAIPGKQMAIDADLSAGTIDEYTAQKRRRELEEESAFFGSMDGASKFVRGDAIAGLIILAVNIFGGIVIGISRHGMTFQSAADVYTKLSVGDGLVSQIPALIISLAAGLLVAKGGTRGSTEKAVLGQLSGYPHALMLTALLLFILGLVPNLPFIPFALLGAAIAAVGLAIPRQRAREIAEVAAMEAANEQRAIEDARVSIKEQLRTAEIELCFSKELVTPLLASYEEMSNRVARMRRKFAREYGFVVPEIRIRDDIDVPARMYQIRLQGTVLATNELRVREHIVILNGGRRPEVPCDEVREPAFGMPALSIADAYVNDVKRQGFKPIDSISVLLTHLSEVVRNNLAQLLSYKDMRGLLERLDPEYKKLLDEIVPSQLSYSGLQAVLKKLLSERVSIRNLNLILEAVAECAAILRRSEQIAEFVRSRLNQQICGELQVDGAIKILRLGNRWDLAFHQSLKRDAKGEVAEFDLDPRLIDEFVAEATTAIRERLENEMPFALVTTPDARPYVRMIIERIFPTLPVLSQLEIARGFEVRLLGSIFLMAGLDTLLGVRTDTTIIANFAVFCRVGGCLMLAPGFSAPQVFMMQRLWIAVGLSLAIAPLCIDAQTMAAMDGSAVSTARLFIAELAVGLLMGSLGRFFMSGLETLMSGVATMIGLANPFGVEVDHNLSMPPIASFLVVAVTVLLFEMDLHVELLRGLTDSYSVISFGSQFDTGIGLTRLVNVLQDAFMVALRICSPFIVYAMVVNVATSLVNRIAPQIAIYVIAMPFSIAGGIFLLFFAMRPMLLSFIAELARVFKLS